jgi:hypothetical protein
MEYWLIYWLIVYDGVILCLRTAAINGPIVHLPGDMWAWRAIVMMMVMPVGNKSWLVHQSSLTVLLAETSGASRRNGRRIENIACQYLKYLKRSSTCRKILRHGNSGFTSHPKEGVLRIFIALKNSSPRPGSNPRPLGPMASILTTTPPRSIWQYAQLVAVYVTRCSLIGLEPVPTTFGHNRCTNSGFIAERLGPQHTGSFWI